MDSDSNLSPTTRDDGLGLHFDAGLNSSAAWAGHFDTTGTTPPPNDSPLNLDRSWAPAVGTPARALRDFNGNVESSEL